MPHTWYDLPEDVREDLPRAPRPFQETLLRQMSWTEEEIVALLGQNPDSCPEDHLEPDLNDHFPDEDQPDQKQEKHFPKHLIAVLAGAVAFLAAVVDVVVNWETFISTLRSWFPWLLH